MNNLIEWPRAQYWNKCWNPIIGCEPCSPACENCYAAALARRFKMSFVPHRTKQRMPTKGVVFCGNMTDLFGDWVTDKELIDFHEQMFRCADDGLILGPHRAEYLWLTKRVSRMARFVEQYHGQIISGWQGMTAENQESYDRRIDDFRSIAPHYTLGSWLSAEPLLGPIDLRLGYVAPEDIPFEWVVVGCESGPNRRPCSKMWVRQIVHQCRALGIKVFVKQLDIDGKCVTDINKFPEDLRIRQVPWGVEE